jgi:hypothetical protein
MSNVIDLAAERAKRIGQPRAPYIDYSEPSLEVRTRKAVHAARMRLFAERKLLIERKLRKSKKVVK